MNDLQDAKTLILLMVRFLESRELGELLPETQMWLFDAKAFLRRPVEMRKRE